MNEKYAVTETGQDSESQQFSILVEKENFGEYERSDFGNNKKHMV